MAWTAEQQREYMREYGRKNRAILREKKKLQIANNPAYAASLRRSKANWRANNKGYMSDYNKKRKISDPSFKIRMLIRSRIYNAMRGNKTSSAIDSLGCSIDEFKKYIESQFHPWMSWGNHGAWELDHIKPLSKFNLTIPEQFAEACHYTNYQPLWKSHNRAKRNN